jgi:peroxiredoxin
MRIRCHGFVLSLAVLAMAFSAGCATTGGETPAADAAAVSSGAASAGPVLTPATKNPKAPDVSFLDLAGKETPLSSFAGKQVVLVNFWGVRCQNCIEEMPFLERLYHKYGGKGLYMVGVNTDGIDAAMIGKFLPNLPKVSYPLAVDPEFKVNDAFQMSAAPLTILVAKDGTIRYRHEGYEPAIEQEYIDLIDKLLAE